MRRRILFKPIIVGYGNWTVSVSVNPTTISNTGGTVAITATASRTVNWSDGSTTTERATPSLSTTAGTLSGTKVTIGANTSTSVKTITITATYSGVSKTATVELAGKTIKSYSDWSISVSASPSTGISAAGGTSTITRSASRTATWTDNSTTTETATPTLSTNLGSISGNILTLSANKTESVKTATITATHGGKSNTCTVKQNADTVSEYGNVNLTVGTIADVPASGGSKTSTGSSATLILTWVSGRTTTVYPSITEGSTGSIASKGTTISNRTSLGNVTVTATGQGSKTASGTITAYQAGNYVTGVSLAAGTKTVSYSTAGAGASSSTKSESGSLAVTYTFTSTSTSTTAPSTTYGSLSYTTSHSMTASGNFTAINLSNGTVTVSSKGTDVSDVTTGPKVTVTWKATWTPTTSYKGSTINSSNFSLTAYPKLAANVKTLSSISAWASYSSNKPASHNQNDWIAAGGGYIDGYCLANYSYTSGSSSTADVTSSATWTSEGKYGSISGNRFTVGSRGADKGSDRYNYIYASYGGKSASFNTGNEANNSTVKSTSGGVTTYGNVVAGTITNATVPASGGERTATAGNGSLSWSTTKIVTTYTWTSGAESSAVTTAAKSGTNSVSPDYSSITASGSNLGTTEKAKATLKSQAVKWSANGKSASGTMYVYQAANAVTNSAYNAYNDNYWAYCSIGSGITAGGGSATVSKSAGHTYYYQYLYTSGGIAPSSTTYYSSAKSDSCTIAITSDGNNRFSLSGTTLSHSTMGTNATTDSCTVRCTNSSKTSAVDDATVSVTNSATYGNVSVSSNGSVSSDIPASGGDRTASGGSGTLTVSYTSGSTRAGTVKCGSYSKVSANSLGTTIKVRTKIGDSTATLTGEGNKTATVSVAVYQAANLVTGVTANSNSFSYNNIGAGATSASPSSSHSPKYTFTSTSTSTTTPSSTYGSLSTSVSYSIANTTTNGFTACNSSSGALTATHRGTTIGNARTSATVTKTLKYTWTPKSGYGSAVNSGNLTKTASCTLNGNYVTSVEAVASNTSNSSNHFYYAGSCVAAGGGSKTASLNGECKGTFSSGSTTNLGTSYTGLSSVSYSRTWTKTSGNGSVDNSGTVTFDNNTTASLRTISVKSVLTVSITHNSTYSSGGSKSDTWECSTTCCLSAGSVEYRITPSVTSMTLAAGGDSKTSTITYSTIWNGKTTASGSALSSYTISEESDTLGIVSASGTSGTVTILSTNNKSTNSGSFSYKISASGYTAATISGTVNVGSKKYGAWSVSISANPTNIGAAGGKSTITASASRTWGWNTTSGEGTLKGTIKLSVPNDSVATLNGTTSGSTVSFDSNTNSSSSRSVVVTATCQEDTSKTNKVTVTLSKDTSTPTTETKYDYTCSITASATSISAAGGKPTLNPSASYCTSTRTKYTWASGKAATYSEWSNWSDWVSSTDYSISASNSVFSRSGNTVTVGSLGTTLSDGRSCKYTITYLGKSDSVTISQLANHIVSISIYPDSTAVSNTHVYYGTKNAAAGTISPTLNGNATVEMSSGSTLNWTACSNYNSLFTWSRTYSGSTTGAKVNSSTGVVTWEANTSSTSSRSVSVTSKLTVTYTHSGYAGGTVTGTRTDTVSCTQSKDSVSSTTSENGQWDNRCSITASTTSVSASGGTVTLTPKREYRYKTRDVYTWVSGNTTYGSWSASYTNWAEDTWSTYTITGSATGFTRDGNTVTVASRGSTTGDARSCKYILNFNGATDSVTITLRANTATTVNDTLVYGTPSISSFSYSNVGPSNSSMTVSPSISYSVTNTQYYHYKYTSGSEETKDSRNTTVAGSASVSYSETTAHSNASVNQSTGIVTWDANSMVTSDRSVGITVTVANSKDTSKKNTKAATSTCKADSKTGGWSGLYATLSYSNVGPSTSSMTVSPTVTGYAYRHWQSGHKELVNCTGSIDSKSFKFTSQGNASSINSSTGVVTWPANPTVTSNRSCTVQVSITTPGLSGTGTGTSTCLADSKSGSAYDTYACSLSASPTSFSASGGSGTLSVSATGYTYQKWKSGYTQLVTSWNGDGGGTYDAKVSGKPSWTSVTRNGQGNWTFTVDSMGTTEYKSGRSGTFTLYFGDKSATASISQSANTKSISSYGAVTAGSLSYSSTADIPASGGTITITPSAGSLVVYYKWSSGSDGGSGTATVAAPAAQTISGSDLGTTVRDRYSLGSRTFIWTGLNSKSALKQSNVIYQQANAITSYKYKWLTCSVSYSQASYSGGTVTPSASGTLSKIPVYTSTAEGTGTTINATPNFSSSAFNVSGTGCSVSNGALGSISWTANSSTSVRSATVSGSVYANGTTNTTSFSTTAKQSGKPATTYYTAKVTFTNNSSYSPVVVRWKNSAGVEQSPLMVTASANGGTQQITLSSTVSGSVTFISAASATNSSVSLRVSGWVSLTASGGSGGCSISN